MISVLQYVCSTTRNLLTTAFHLLYVSFTFWYKSPAVFHTFLSSPKSEFVSIWWKTRQEERDRDKTKVIPKDRKDQKTGKKSGGGVRRWKEAAVGGWRRKMGWGTEGRWQGREDKKEGCRVFLFFYSLGWKKCWWITDKNPQWTQENVTVSCPVAGRMYKHVSSRYILCVCVCCYMIELITGGSCDAFACSCCSASRLQS